MKLLIVEDNRVLSDWLSRALGQSQYAVDCAYSGLQADALLTTETYDAVLLDVALPLLDGREVLRRLRRRSSNVPVLVLTAHDAIRERIASLDAGADDYMSKPFDLGELEARLRALMRRALQNRNPHLQCGSLRYDANTREFRDDRCAFALTPREHAVLEVLITHSGKTVSKKMLADSLFSVHDDATADSMEIYVHRLRRKLERSSARILTLRGLGYLLKAVDDA